MVDRGGSQANIALNNDISAAKFRDLHVIPNMRRRSCCDFLLAKNNVQQS